MRSCLNSFGLVIQSQPDCSVQYAEEGNFGTRLRGVSVLSSELGPPPPPPSKCVSTLGSKGGEQHSFTVKGVGGPNSDDWTESLSLCILLWYKGKPSLLGVVEILTD